MRHVSRVVLGALFALLSCAASADPVNYSVQVTATEGSLAGIVANGTFSFDDSIIPPGGGNVVQAGLLTDLDFTWNGTAYTEATANTGYLSFDAAGDLTAFCFGNNPGAGFCSVLPGLDHWLVAPSLGLAYSVSGATSVYAGTLSFQEITAVPEPGTVFLILAGLMALLMHCRRAEFG